MKSPGSNRKGVKTQLSPTMGKPSPKKTDVVKEQLGPKCDRHERNKERALKKSIDSWGHKSNASLKGSVISQPEQDSIGPEGGNKQHTTVIPAPTKNIIASEEKTT